MYISISKQVNFLHDFLETSELIFVYKFASVNFFTQQKTIGEDCHFCR